MCEYLIYYHQSRCLIQRMNLFCCSGINKIIFPTKKTTINGKLKTSHTWKQQQIVSAVCNSRRFVKCCWGGESSANHERGLQCHELIQHAYSWYVPMQNNICFPTTYHLFGGLCDINGSSRSLKKKTKTKKKTTRGFKAQLWWSLSVISYANRVSIIYM